jgi:hypothetical protein
MASPLVAAPAPALAAPAGGCQKNSPECRVVIDAIDAFIPAVV